MRALLLLALMTTPALAAPQCGVTADVVTSLAVNYGEALQSSGLAQDGTVMGLYASPETGTWTLTVTLPNGMTCLVAAGRDYMAAPQGDPA
jgi:ABC-type Mn2+/Zn2+ transport system permease subunit